MPVVNAVTVLTVAFNDGSMRPGPEAENQQQSVVISWPSVPVELVRAAELRPVIVRGGAAATPAADVHLSDAVFPNRIRQLVEAILVGRWSDAAGVVLPRTAEPDYKCFLYLRELARRGRVQQPVPVLLFDLLQSTGREVAAHNAGRTRALFAALGAAGGNLSIDRLAEEITRANAARAALRRLVALRGGSPRITGADVLPLIGAFWQLQPEVYAPLATAAADDIARRAPLDGPRVLLVGAPVDGPALHAAIEAHGAVVVAETGPWGVDAAGEDVAGGADLFSAIAEKYRRDAWGPRTSIGDVRRWITRRLADSDAVVVSLPPDDAVFGWDYPWLRQQLQAVDVPHVRLTHDPCEPVPDADHERLAALMRLAMPRAEARRG